MNLKKTLALLLVVTLSASFGLFVTPASLVSARISNEGAAGGANKILILNVQPGDSVYTYVGQTVAMVPPGITTPMPNFAARFDTAPGGQVQTYAPLGQVTSVYVFAPANYSLRLIGVVQPTSAWPDTILDANTTVQVAQTPSFPNRGTAMPVIIGPSAAQQAGSPQPAQPPSAMSPGNLNKGLSSPQPPGTAPQDNPNRGIYSPAGTTVDFTQTYKVAAGDTLSALAARFGTTVAALAAANGLADPNKLRVGQELMVPPLPGQTSSSP